jgi:branched-chain amino acid transport system substrate-binding protein
MYKKKMFYNQKGGFTVQKMLALLVVFGLTISCFIGCAKKEESQIRIGIILPLTGKAAMIGEPEKKATELFMQNKNPNIKILIEDSKGEPKEAVSLVNKMISKEDIDVFIVSMSHIANAVAPIITKNKKILFVHTANPGLVDNVNVFRLYPDSENEAKFIIEYVKNKFKKISLLVPNNDLGLMLENVFSAKLGSNIIFSEKYDIGQKDYRNIITKMKNKNPDAVIFEGYPFDIPVFSNQFIENKINAAYLTSMAAIWGKTEKALRELKIPVVFPAPAFFHDKLCNNLAKKFKKEYFGIFNENPGYDEAYLYDTLLLINNLTEKGFNKNEFVEKLTSLSNYEGINGMISNSSGNFQTELYLFKITGDKTEILTE